MRTIYVDSHYRCHVTDDGNRTALTTDFFDGKCDTFVEGYCLEPYESGEKCYPWKAYPQLQAAQQEYEGMLDAYREGVNSL